MPRRLAALRAAITAPGAEYGVMTATLVLGVLFAGLALRQTDEERAREVRAAEQQIAWRERQAVSAFAAILQQSRAKKITDAEAAARVERDVLPVWREARGLAEAARSGLNADAFPAELPTFFRLRQEAWESLVAAVKNQDAAAIARFHDKWAEADRVAATIREDREKRPAPP